MSTPSAPPDGRLPVRVVATRLESVHVTSFELAAVDGSPLPAWDPGCHVDVHLPSGTVRQYSLCGDPQLPTYRIAVLELPDGRGGSVEAHRELRAGAELTIGLPRQEFPLVDAARYVLVAGGIGITPVLAMARELACRGADWRLLYGARSDRHVSFHDELTALGPDRVNVVTEAAGAMLDLTAVARDAGSAVYCCGPAGLMDALTGAMADAGRADDLHLERFSTAPVAAADPGGGFEVELARSGLTVSVPPDRTVLEAVRAVGVDHPSSCEMGFCGTCETKVLDGRVDHRDDLLTEEERATGCTMMLCVSRAACPRLVLDL